MTITASMVNELRKRTGVGMMLCKKALGETAGDYDAAVEWLRKYGASIGSGSASGDAPTGAFEATVLVGGHAVETRVVDCGTGFSYTDGHLTVDVKDCTTPDPRTQCGGGYTLVVKGIKRD